MTMLAGIAVFALAYLGCGAVALGQRRHWHVGSNRDDGRRAAPRRRVLGCVALGLALAIALVADGVGFGAVRWSLCVMLAGIGVAATFAWWPSLLRPLVLSTRVTRSDVPRRSPPRRRARDRS